MIGVDGVVEKLGVDGVVEEPEEEVGGGGVSELEEDEEPPWTHAPEGFNAQLPARGFDYRRPLRITDKSILDNLSPNTWDVDGFKLTVDVLSRPKNLD
eukprot:2149958-Prymnesium_polylepis.1